MFENSSVEVIEEDKSKGLSSFLLFHLLTLLVRENLNAYPQQYVKKELHAFHLSFLLAYGEI